ncbi:MAG: glycosyltransferase family 2 protein [Desulfobacca sp.]|uniref:glycosyltransferase family 2 protein n=1 Tax=Desulfobacca sp. TaxID=2067990 RepID=UPI00404B2701
MTLLFLLYLLASSLCCLVTVYLLVLTGAAWGFRKKLGVVSEPPPKIAVVIPAHNEENGIAATIASVQGCNYPPTACEIMVIADNCTDATAAVAQAAGAKVWVRVEPARRGKGQALDWFLQQWGEAARDYDTVAVIDADTQVSPAFLAEVAASLAHPEVQVVQGFYGVANPEDNWRTVLATAALSVFHHLRPAGRNRLGGSAGLKGNGMAFRTAVLQRWGWPARSIVEDLEFSLMLLLNQVLVHYNPEAAVYGEMARTRQQAGVQRQRWESGRWHMVRTYAPRLLQQWWRTRQVALLDGFLDLATPPLALLVTMTSILGLTGLALFPGAALLPWACLLGQCLYVAAGLWLRRVPWRVWLYLGAAPVFILWKLPIHLASLCRRYTGAWQRTPRQAEARKE